MPEIEENSSENTEVVDTYTSVSQNSLDNELLREISNDLKVINENEILIIQRLDNLSVSSGSVSSNDITAIKNGVNSILEETVSANEIKYDDIITRDFSEYTLSESLLLIMLIVLFLSLVYQFFKGKNYF